MNKNASNIIRILQIKLWSYISSNLIFFPRLIPQPTFNDIVPLDQSLSLVDFSLVAMTQHFLRQLGPLDFADLKKEASADHSGLLE